MSKIAVYTISLNEAKHVARFMASCKGADAVYVVDTGSTDGTVEALVKAGAIVKTENINPWRFDVARNVSLDFVPKDFDWCVCLDMDEILKDGWREKLEQTIADSPKATKIRYLFTWNWKTRPVYSLNGHGLRLEKPGKPDIIFLSEKIHRRNKYAWKKACHEVLIPKAEEEICLSGLEIEHLADDEKPRSSYLSLLELSYEEDPNDDRNCHYLGREYYHGGMYDKAIVLLLRYLDMKTNFLAERAASFLLLADCYGSTNREDQRLRYILAACGEAPTFREPWVELAKYYHEHRDYLGCYFAAKKALDIEQRQLCHITDGIAWGDLP